jgi:hypothetical protein
MTAALPFINQRLDDARKTIDADLFHWLSGYKFPNIGFSGSLVDNYWGPYLDGHARQLTELAFVASKELAAEHGLDPYDTVEDAWNGAENAVGQIIDRMQDYDRRMRGKGVPTSVPMRDVTGIRERHSAAIRKRAENERALMSERKKTEIVLTSEHGFLWYWVHSHYFTRWVTIPATLLTVFMLGFGACRSSFFSKVVDAFTSISASSPTTSDTQQEPKK